jgi:hypothetical protein
VRIARLSSLLLFVVTTSLAADESLRNARRAQALLGPMVWSQIIQIENTAQNSPYPGKLHALVFELEGLLWFYSDADGTQSFSLHRGRLAEEKADFAPLLREIDPGFIRWSAVPTGSTANLAASSEGDLRNGCFIESYAILRRLVARGEPVTEPRLLSYYARVGGQSRGHTVLTYSVYGYVVVIDPLRPDKQRGFSPRLAETPRQLARALLGPGLIDARVLPLALPRPAAGEGLIAAQGSSRSIPMYN